MSTVKDRYVIDLTCVEGDKYILIILDDIEWNCATRADHARMLKDKIGDYCGYIRSGQASEVHPDKRCVIRILAQYSYSQYSIDFLGRVSDFIKNDGDFCDLEWTHDYKDGEFNDGFSDEYVFDKEKLYPRIRKNWADDPLNEVKLMSMNDSSDFENMPMFRFLDSFVVMVMQDTGVVYSYLTYDRFPEDTDFSEIWDKCFENLSRDVQFRYEESKVKGIYGILCGGDFEAESLCFSGMWLSIANEFGDDLMVTVPTKDIVLFTRLGDKKLCKEMIKMAREMFDTNRKETPNLLFCKDVFIFKREDEQFSIDKKLSL